MTHTNNYGRFKADSIQLGSDTNNATVDSTLGKRYSGTTTVWKDMIMDLFGRRLYSAVGTVDYDYDENAIVFSPSGSISDRNDRVGGNQEIYHEMKVGTSISFYPHIHWWQQVTTGVEFAATFTIRYRLQDNGSGKTTSWTTFTITSGGSDDVFDFSGEADGLYNQITASSSPITLNCGISDTIQIQMTRTDANAGDVSVYFFDLHGEVDSDGSDEMLTKN